jgi:osmotically-inducible protein OsmY
MTKPIANLITAAFLSLSGAAIPAWAIASPPSESAGEALDDTVITTQVKAALLNEPSLKSFQISVKTYKDTVQLSGFVDSAAAKQTAGRVAASIKGVASVRNDLIVK